MLTVENRLETYLSEREINSVRKYAFETAKEMHLGGFFPTAIPATRFHMFNLFLKDPCASEDVINQHLGKMKHLSRLEEQSQRDGILPTIGVEIEVPKTKRVKRFKKYLKDLGIRNEDAQANQNGVDLWEFNPTFSYNSFTQARILQEFVEIGIIPITGNQIPKDTSLSLHINIGVLEELEEWLGEHIAQTRILNELLTYSYTSPKRLKSRKTSTSLTWNKSALPIRGRRMFTRIEMRATEFKDASGYRMLAEAQEIWTCLFAFIKNPKERTELDWELAKIWASLEFEYTRRQGIMDKYCIPLGSLDKRIKEASKIASNTDISSVCRSLLSEHTWRFNKLLSSGKK